MQKKGFKKERTNNSVLLFLVAMPGAPSSVLLFLVVRPGAPSSVLLFLVVRPGAPSSVAVAWSEFAHFSPAHQLGAGGRAELVAELAPWLSLFCKAASFCLFGEWDSCSCNTLADGPLFLSFFTAHLV